MGWKRRLELRAVNPVVPGIRACPVRQRDLGPWKGIGDDLRHLADLVVFVRTTDVGRLVVDGCPRRFENSPERPTHVFDVDQRTPAPIDWPRSSPWTLRKASPD